ncbi:MAG: alginate biosynthesis protein Alg44 [Pseudomonadota bacterium]
MTLQLVADPKPQISASGAAQQDTNRVSDTRVQRQHPRYRLPLEARLNGAGGSHIWPVSDWSVAGAGLVYTGAQLELGSQHALELVLPMRDCSVSVTLDAQVRHCNPQDKRLGLQFVNVTEHQTGLLRFAIDELLSGRVIDSDGVLFFTQADSTAKPRGASADAAPLPHKSRLGGWAQRGLGLGLGTLIGATALALLLSTLYDDIFTFEAVSASVTTPTLALTSPVDGIAAEFSPTETVGAGETAFTIVDATGARFDVRSPCDCAVLSTAIQPGNYVAAGSALSTLALPGETPQVTATVRYDRLPHIAEGARITLTYLDGTMVRDAQLKAVPPVTASASGLVEIEVAPGKPLTIAQFGEPVHVQFSTMRWPQWTGAEALASMFD